MNWSGRWENSFTVSVSFYITPQYKKARKVKDYTFFSFHQDRQPLEIQKKAIYFWDPLKIKINR